MAADVLPELFDLAPDMAIFAKNGAGRHLAVNESLVKRRGCRHKSQVMRRRPCDTCPGDFGPLPAEQDAQVLRTRTPLIDHLEQQRYLPQKPAWCLTTKLPLLDRPGKVVGLIGISRDVRAPADPRSQLLAIATKRDQEPFLIQGSPPLEPAAGAESEPNLIPPRRAQQRQSVRGAQTFQLLKLVMLAVRIAAPIPQCCQPAAILGQHLEVWPAASATLQWGVVNSRLTPAGSREAAPYACLEA